MPAPRGTAATAMTKMTPETQIKNAGEIFTFLKTQGSDLQDLNGEYTRFTEICAAPGTHQVKLVYGMGLGTERMVQKYPMTNKIPTLYGEGGPIIGPSQILLLDATVKYKVLIKNLNPEDVQTGSTNRHAVDYQLKR